MAKTIIFVLLMAHVLALVGLLGYGVATGRLDSEKMEQYLATWRGEKLVPFVEEEVVELAKESPQEASSRIKKAQVEHEFLNRELQRQVQLVRNMQVTVDVAQSKLKKDLEILKKQRLQLDTEYAKQKEAAKNEGFLKALKNYSAMKPKLVMNDFMKMNEKEAVRYLGRMKTDIATAILNQFKTPAQQAKRLRLMQLLEQHKVIELSKVDG